MDVCLGAMPEAIFRMYLWSQPIDFEFIFSKILGQVKQSKHAGSVSRQIAYELYPELFIQPKAEYMASMLYKLCNAGIAPVWVYVGNAYFDQLQAILHEMPAGIKHEFYINNTRWRDDRSDEAKNDLDTTIKNHAILDVILNSKTWGESYLKGRVPFENEEIMNELEFKKSFVNHYNRYKTEWLKYFE